jgi:6-phosphogluconate dehydrogenase
MAERTLADVGLIGLAVMGRNLALNIADHGFKVAVFNRTTQVDPKTGKPIETALPGGPVESRVPCTAYIGETAQGIT